MYLINKYPHDAAQQPAKEEEYNTYTVSVMIIILGRDTKRYEVLKPAVVWAVDVTV